MNKKVYKILLGIMAAIIIFSPQLLRAKAATGYIAVLYHSQPNWYYCGCACLEMVFDYFGPDIDQVEIADAARTDGTDPPFGTYQAEMIRAAHFSDMSTSMGESASHVTGYTGRGLGYASSSMQWATTDNLESWIDAGYPIIVFMWDSEAHNYRHFRVVVGYDDVAEIITVHDPLPSTWESFGGPDYDYSYTLFDDLWIGNNWALFVSPWEVSISIPPTSVTQGDTFTVEADIVYPCPPPFPTSYPAFSSEATIQLPAELNLAAGETATKSLGTFSPNTLQTVQWDVVAVGSGPVSLSIEAEGQVSEHMLGHAAGVFTDEYDYTDRIGGIDSVTVDVIPSGPVLVDPMACFDWSPKPGTAGSPVSFDASCSTDPDGTIVSYSWDFDGTGTDTGVNPDHTFATDGTYTVTLTVTDDDGLTDTITHDVTIEPVPVEEIHDVEAVSQVADPGTVDPGDVVGIEVTVRNNGDFTDTFDLTCYYDSVQIGTIPVVDLAPGETRVVTFTWDTTGLPVGEYQITAWADSAEAIVEVDETNNWCTAEASVFVGQVVPTIESCDSMGATKDTFDIMEEVYATGTGYSASTTYDVYLVEDVTWVDGMAIPPRVAGTMATVTSDAAGNVPATLLWSDPLVPGKYDIVVDIDGDGLYYAESDALDDNDIEVTAGFFVIPEVPLGTIAVSASMIVALAAYFALPRLRRRRSK